ncbi:MAG: isoaspartyl peptidase/L-asparaginase, partial [Gammaproteobacteria bacterium]|nr:isoaspartyl peptidase/L-asparaginase [Gammaproteobacteria bacterium]
MNGTPCQSKHRYTILVHGGTVTHPDEVTEAQLELICAVVAAAGEDLAAGATAVDVVVEAIVKLEDSGQLDAGKGSFLNTAGFAETDASLMQGHTGQAGAVAAMQRLKNPIRGARITMERTPHVLFVGPPGEETLIGLGAESVDDPAAYFLPIASGQKVFTGEGTVGAVALDRCGHLAAGTSTGGTPGQLVGRVGDSPIIGAGTFANERYALSATGVGEYLILRSAARDIAMRAEYQGVSLQDAADHVIHRLIGEVDKASA